MSVVRAGIAAVQKEGGGVIEVRIILPGDADGLLQRVVAGDQVAAQTMQVLGSVLGRIDVRPPRKPMTCACCPKSLRAKRCAIVIGIPDRDSASSAVAIGVCSDCASGRDAVRGKAVSVLRGMWPGADLVEAAP